MRRYRIVHTTGFKYQSDVNASYNEIRMLPIQDDYQLVFNSRLDIKPHGTSQEFEDYFGSRVVSFEVLEQHSELVITATNVVELRPRNQTANDCSWQTLAEQIQRSVMLTDAVTNSKRTMPPVELAKFARKQADTMTPSDAAMSICKFIFEKMTYLSGETGVHSIATEAWSKKSGVCQDFTHLALGALRSVGIPARYVSGYLHPQPDPIVGKTVVGESHAWIEWFCGTWIGFDPTNDVPAQERHVVVARGRDYDDVPPLRGVFNGYGQSELFVSVEITREA